MRRDRYSSYSTRRELILTGKVESRAISQILSHQGAPKSILTQRGKCWFETESLHAKGRELSVKSGCGPVAQHLSGIYKALGWTSNHSEERETVGWAFAGAHL